MLSVKKSFTLFVLAFAVTLCLSAPASLLGAFIKSRTHGALEFTSPTGTIWHGSAIPLLQAPHEHPESIQRINWNLSLLPLLHGRISLLINEGNSTPATEIGFGINSVELRHASLELPASALGYLNPMLQALHPGGSLQLTADHLTLSGKLLQGKATAKWLSASSAISTINPFGNYQVGIDGKGNQVAIDLSTLSGPLLLNGQGTWSRSGGLSLEVRAKAVAKRQNELADLLNHLGPEISPGTHVLKIGKGI